MCIPINVKNIIYPLLVGINNKDCAAQYDICTKLNHADCATQYDICSKINHVDYKYLQGSKDLMYCFSCCSKAFPFGKLTNKDVIFSTLSSLSLKVPTVTMIKKDCFC